MLGGFVRADEEHWDVTSIAFFQNGVLVDVYFSQNGAKFSQQWRYGGLRFFAEMASGARIKSDVARAAGCEPRVFGRVARAHGFPSSASRSSGVFAKSDMAG